MSSTAVEPKDFETFCHLPNYMLRKSFLVQMIQFATSSRGFFGKVRTLKSNLEGQVGTARPGSEFQVEGAAWIKLRQDSLKFARIPKGPL